jgi:putative acetyltransferase
MSLRIQLETPDQPEAAALISELDRYLYDLYPADGVYALGLAALLAPNVLFAMARGEDGQALGCGAMVLGPGHAELKRMFVRPIARGQGVARALLGFLEQAAMARGARQLLLETGPHQPEALALYTAFGYRRCGPFGDYPDHPSSLFMRKTAAQDESPAEQNAKL